MGPPTEEVPTAGQEGKVLKVAGDGERERVRESYGGRGGGKIMSPPG